jgi:hypothetical protein
MGFLLIKHVLLFIGEDLSDILAGKVTEILKDEISHEIAQTIMGWWNLHVRDSSVYKIKEKLDGVNGAKPLFWGHRMSRSRPSTHGVTGDPSGS